MREFQQKLLTGEYIYEYLGYYPSDLGIFYGNCNRLGGEEPFLYLTDFFAGIGDVEWWNNTLLQQLSNDQKQQLLILLERNVFFKNYVNKYNDEVFNFKNVEFSRLSNLEKIIYIYLTQKINESTDLFEEIYKNNIEIKDMNIQESFKIDYSYFYKKRYQQCYLNYNKNVIDTIKELSDEEFIDEILKGIIV